MQTSGNTTVVGAALGAAVGSIVVYLAELLGKVDLPGPIEGSVVVVCTALVALVYPESPR